MKINTNINAVNASRMIKVNNTDQKKSVEKLSSGSKINRAADDASGLQISEKLRKQIRGLTKGAQNAQDGLSLVQIADGAMAEVHDMMDRGIELSIKAANGTLSESDRELVQEEIVNLKSEIDGIGKRTKFNEIYIFDGLVKDKVEKHEDIKPSKVQGVVVKGSLPQWVMNNSPSLIDGFMSDKYNTEQEYTYTDQTTLVSKTGKMDVEHASGVIDFSSLTAKNVKDLIGKGFHTTCCTCNNHYSIEFTNSTGNSYSKSGTHNIYKIGIKGVTTADDLIDRIIAGTDNGNPNSHYTKFAKDGDKLVIYDDRPYSGRIYYDNNGNSITSWTNWKNSSSSGRPNIRYGYGLFAPGVAHSANEHFGAKRTAVPISGTNIKIQVGAEAQENNGIGILLPTISCKSLGLLGTNVLTEESAKKAIEEFSSAKDTVSSDRARIGAYQNRLEHTIYNLNNVIENTTSSDSLIRDTDMASEMVTSSKNNILIEASQSMLAQANHSNDAILKMLQ